MSTLDRLRISESRRKERMEAMEEVKRCNALEVWKFFCPTCFADPGEPCMTRTGKRYSVGRHTTRPSGGVSENQPRRTH